MMFYKPRGHQRPRRHLGQVEIGLETDLTVNDDDDEILYLLYKP